MNILVIGRGWTGKKMIHELSKRGHNVSDCSHTEVFSVLNKNDQFFEWVVNCAGVTGFPNVDACEFKKKETIDGNAIFPVLVHQVCEAKGIRFAHFSSGCIYQGTIDDVNTDPNFFGSIYSVSKGISDTYLKDKAHVYRIRMPFTGIDEPKNYLSKVLKYARTGKLIEGGLNSLTDLDEAVRVAVTLIEQDAPNNPYNLVHKGAVTMHEIVQILDIKPTWYTPEEFAADTVAKRSNCVIPAYEEMSPIIPTLTAAINSLLTP